MRVLKNSHFLLFNVFVVADVILAVAVIAVATGAVTELQLRVAHIRAATDRAAMVVILGLCLIGRGVGNKGDRAGLFRLLFSALLFLFSKLKRVFPCPPICAQPRVSCFRGSTGNSMGKDTCPLPFVRDWSARMRTKHKAARDAAQNRPLLSSFR